MSRKTHCPECGEPLGRFCFSILVKGTCFNRRCSSFKKQHSWQQDLCKFLDLAPYTKKQFLELPNDTPVWIEYRWDKPAICCASDIYLGSHFGNASFAIADQLPIIKYGKDWRAWPTYKTFRPDQYDLEHHPW